MNSSVKTNPEAAVVGGGGMRDLNHDMLRERRVLKIEFTRGLCRVPWLGPSEQASGIKA